MIYFILIPIIFILIIQFVYFTDKIDKLNKKHIDNINLWVGRCNDLIEKINNTDIK